MEILRTCVCCRTQNDKRDMLRVVKNKEGKVFIDRTHKANGRGAYVCSKKECIIKALKSGILGRQLKTEIPDDVKNELKALGENASK